MTLKSSKNFWLHVASQWHCHGLIEGEQAFLFLFRSTISFVPFTPKVTTNYVPFPCRITTKSVPLPLHKQWAQPFYFLTNLYARLFSLIFRLQGNILGFWKAFHRFSMPGSFKYRTLFWAGCVCVEIQKYNSGKYYHLPLL